MLIESFEVHQLQQIRLFHSSTSPDTEWEQKKLEMGAIKLENNP